MSWAAPAALGAFGLYQSGQQNKRAQDAANRAQGKVGKITDQQASAMEELRRLADAYDPAAHTKTAIDTASGVASQTLEKALRRMKVGYGGGNPEGDSGFAVSAQRGVNDAMDPLKRFAAEESIQGPLRKAAMYQGLLGAPTGQMANNYFNAASLSPRSDPAGSMAILAQALQRMFGDKGGAGGRGDLMGQSAKVLGGG